MTLAEAWEKIECWIAQEAPEEAPLPGPCSRHDLDQLYERIRLPLPQDIEESLLRHNGSGYTPIIPPGYTLLGVEDILKNYEKWLYYASEDDANLHEGDKEFIVPIAEIGAMKRMVDTRTGTLAWWDIGQGYARYSDPLYTSLTTILEFVGNVLASPPPWIAILPGDDEWEATNVDPDFPGRLQWTND